MEKLKAMFNNKTVRSVAAATVVMAVSGAAMAADTTAGTGGGFDPSIILDPIKESLMNNLTKILGVVAGIFAAYWGATSGLQIVRKFLSKATS